MQPMRRYRRCLAAAFSGAAGLFLVGRSRQGPARSGLAGDGIGVLTLAVELHSEGWEVQIPHFAFFLVSGLDDVFLGCRGRDESADHSALSPLLVGPGSSPTSGPARGPDLPQNVRLV